MFCPKCGVSNPDTGKFCRSCGTDLSSVSLALKASGVQNSLSCSDNGTTLEGAMSRLFMGVAFLIVAAVLGLTGIAGGRAWWFWMLIPAFAMMGTGVANYMQIRKDEAARLNASNVSLNSMEGASVNVLPPQQTGFASPASRYRTGDLVPPSVTDNTTRQLEVDREGETMTLPKK